MPIGVDIEFPDECHVELDPYFLQTSDGFISIKGRGSRLVVGRPHSPGSGVAFVVHDGGSVEVGTGGIMGSLRAYALAAGASIKIAKNCAFNGITQITAHEPSAITIGEFCLFGSDCTVASSDVHKILSLRGSKRINPAGNISIGDRVWFGPRAAIFRNSSIGADSVVGWASVVKGQFPKNVVIAGVPARVVKKGIRWES
jgi:hypothetical protein